MRVSLRRQFLFLRVYAIATSLVFIVLATAALRQVGTAQNLGEIKVERINVVDADGTLRMVISNKDRMHPGRVRRQDDRPSTSGRRLDFLQRRGR